MKTILFDLDGTLLPLDMDEFMKAYMGELCKKLAPQIDPKTLPKLVWASTEYMIKNIEEDKTNMDAFFEDFQKRIDNKVEDLLPIFEEFYKFDFAKLKHIVNPNPIVKDIMEELKGKGYEMVIATNPLFPKEAIYHRIEWAGLDKEDFKLITTYEDMHFCKPNLEYYKEILNRINKEASEVMMVGNNVQEDIVANKLGIKTFLIEEYLVDSKDPVYTPDYRGSLVDFYNYTKTLPAQ